MFDNLTFLSVLAGFALILVVGAKLGAGTPDSLVGLFVLPDMPARPKGVQEKDLPPFVFRDVPAPRTTTAAAPATGRRVLGTSAA